MNTIDKKIEKATEEIMRNPGSAAAYERRGDLYTGKGDHDSAAADYNKAAELEPANVKRAKKRQDAIRNTLKP